MSIFQVTVRRRGVSPLTQSMVVDAGSREEAAGIATALAESERGGMFEAARVKSLGSVAPGVLVDA